MKWVLLAVIACLLGCNDAQLASAGPACVSTISFDAQEPSCGDGKDLGWTEIDENGHGPYLLCRWECVCDPSQIREQLSGQRPGQMWVRIYPSHYPDGSSHVTTGAGYPCPER